MKDVIEDAERKKYWNEDYVSYWKARVKEANVSTTQNSDMVAGDVKTSTDKLYFNAIDFLNISKHDHVLEVGCGFGRSLPLLCQRASLVTAVDISEQMIAEARQACQEKNVRFYVSPSEKLPLLDESCDVVVCYAAFDAMYQTGALIEMNRVCKKGARILLTGKNDNYHADDEAAIAAEAGARAKKHPNYFTDVEKLVKNIDIFGFKIDVQKYFLKRGDFTLGLSSDEMPERFYEYMFILSKVSNGSVSEDFIISKKISKTFVNAGV